MSDYSIYELGYDKALDRSGRGSIDVPQFPDLTDNVSEGGIVDLISTTTAPNTIISGPLRADLQQAAGTIYNGKSTFDNTDTGYILGVDTSDSLMKFYIGSSSDYLNWTGTALTISGTFTAGTIIGSDLHVPDQDTTANSWHVNSTGNMWLGATETNFNADNTNAAAYVLSTGEARFANITITSSSSSVEGDAVVGGWTATSSTLTNTSGGNTVTFSTGATAIISGPTGSPTFSVTQAGALTSTSGNIAGWTIAAATLTSSSSGIILNDTSETIAVGSGSPNLTIDGANTRIRSSDYVSGVAGAGFTLEPTLLEVGNVAVRGIIRTAVFQKGVISAVGGSVQLRPADVLATTMAAADATNVVIDGNETFANNDILRIKDGTDDEWMTVTDASGAPTYVVTRDQGSAYGANSNPTWAKGATVVNYGASGSGGVYLTSTDTNAPYIDIFTHAGAPWTTLTTRVRIGDLTGITDAVTSPSGFGIWTDNGFFKGTIVASAGRIGGATDYWSVSAGSMVATSGGGDVEIRSGQTAYNTGTGFWLGIDGGVSKFSFGNSAGAYIAWDGTDLTIQGGLIMNATTGVVTIQQSATTGNSLNVTRNLPSGSTDSAVVEFKNDHASDDQAVLNIVQDAGAIAQQIIQSGDGRMISGTSSSTTQELMVLRGDSLTSANAVTIISDSSNSSSRSILQLTNDNTGATGTAILSMKQDADSTHINMTGDPANTTPTDGDFWYDGTSLNFYDGTSNYSTTQGSAIGFVYVYGGPGFTFDGTTGSSFVVFAPTQSITAYDKGIQTGTVSKTTTFYKGVFDGTNVYAPHFVASNWNVYRYDSTLGSETALSLSNSYVGDMVSDGTSFYIRRTSGASPDGTKFDKYTIGGSLTYSSTITLSDSETGGVPISDGNFLYIILTGTIKKYNFSGTLQTTATIDNAGGTTYGFYHDNALYYTTRMGNFSGTAHLAVRFEF